MKLMSNFYNDIQKGKVGESIFKADFLDFLDIKYVDVTDCQQFQVIDSDYLTKIGTYEIKTNYKDDSIIIIEEYTNCNELYGKISYGWFYKSKADLLVFISKQTRVMILIPFTEKFKKHYETIKEDSGLIRNKVSYHRGNRWQSAFRRVELDKISGYYSMYRKKGEAK
jgi:hypothetical protein